MDSKQQANLNAAEGERTAKPGGEDPRADENTQTAESAQTGERPEKTDAESATTENTRADALSRTEEPAQAGEPGGEMKDARPPKKKRTWIWNLVLVAIIAFGIYSMFSIAGEIGGDGLTFGEAMDRVTLPGILGLAGAVLGVMVLDCLKFCFVNKAVIGKVRPLVAIKTSFLGKFYDNITPFATGGQPMQIYYMTTRGVSGAKSSAVVLIRYFGSIFAFTFIGALFMVLGVSLGYLKDHEARTLLLIAGWVGLAINLIIPVFITFFVFFPKLANRCTTWFINVGAKLRIVKDKQKTMSKALKVVDDFVTSFKYIGKKPLWLTLFILCCIGENFLTFSIPYFAMNFFGCDLKGMFIAVMALNVFATFGVSFIPTPGNSGVVEGMGVLAFSVAAGAALTWSVLFWRFAVYYIYILIGIGMTIFDLVLKNVRAHRAAKGQKSTLNGGTVAPQKEQDE